MNQRAALPSLLIFLFLLAGSAIFAGIGCGSRNASPAPANSPPRIASLVPAATDLLLAIGAGDRLVAVSNYDTTPATSTLPRVGDYQTTDWEKISTLHPTVILTEFGPGRTPPGFTERCVELGIRQLNLHFYRLEDTFTAIGQLGAAAGMPDRAAAAATKLHEQLDAIHRRVAGQPPVPALIVTGEGTLGIAGGGTYLNDLLTLAGGKNVAASLGQPWPTIDRERLAALAPRVIFQLLPGADSRQIATANQTWATFPDLPAVRDHRVVIITDWYAELPGYEVGDLAEKFAEALYPSGTTRP
ncbi:MAG TPA: helical backbone metal receptor [Tepidisphaeraceae bacterium]|jgi:iron complex transport system substrate-binding protein|nr:helical backbone metal receptor [Tepidisphaeraceae bacterium]